MSIDNLIELFHEFLSSSGLTIESMTFEELLDAFAGAEIDLSSFSAGEIQDALHEAFEQSDVPTHEISFSGLTAVAPLADLQVGPVCGFEAIENFIQLGNPGCTNTLSDYLQHSELFDGGGQMSAVGIVLDPRHYQHILGDFGIATEWHEFSHESLAQAISQNRGVLAVGDAHYLNPKAYPTEGANHAFMITDFSRGAHGEITSYKGIDSNFQHQEVSWSPEAIERALGHSLLQQPLLVSLQEMRWPYKTT